MRLGPGDGLKAWLAPGRVALVIVDMQADFALPDGAMARGGADVSAIGPALEEAERLVNAARVAGVPVVFVGLATSPELDSPEWDEWARRTGGDPEIEAPLCRVGTPGAAFVGPTPQSGEAVVSKTRYSGFFGTELHAVLRGLEVDTLAICGLTTECCVATTAFDAFQFDYHVFIARDACAAYAEHLHEAALTAMALNCTQLADTEDIVAAWAAD